MASNQTISNSVIRRLPRYYRFLDELHQNGCQKISSNLLAKRMGLTASQIRQDLNCFGGFGQQGYGYSVEDLRGEIGKILGVDRTNKIVLIGAGNLGHAIATHMDFSTRGFTLTAIFDNNPELIGQVIGDLIVQDIEQFSAFCRAHHPAAVILCVPKQSAQALSDLLIQNQIRGIWNFSHYDFSMNDKNIKVENVHLGDSLMTLSYKINHD